MIDFRYHLVSLIAVFLAVALGIVVGTTALHGYVLDDLESQVSALEQDKRSLEDTTRSLQARLDAEDEFEIAVAPALVEGALADSSVLLVIADEVDEMFLVWDGKPAVGKGGTGDIADHCEQQSIPYVVIWPAGSARP